MSIKVCNFAILVLVVYQDCVTFNFSEMQEKIINTATY